MIFDHADQFEGEAGEALACVGRLYAVLQAARLFRALS